MRAIWRLLSGYRDLRFVLAAGLVSLVGDWALRIGLAYNVYALTGSTVASAMLMLASFVPAVLLSSVAGVFVDRWDRKRTMVAANLLLAAGMLPLLLVDDASRVWVIYVVIFWEGVVQQFFAPAEAAMLPRLVPADRLVAANALNGQNRDLSRLVGSALGGVVAAAGGLGAVAVLDAATFVVSAVLIRMVRTSGRVATESATVSATVSATASATEPATVSLRHRIEQLRMEWVDGLRLATHHRVLRALLAFELVTSIGEGIMATLFAPFVRHVLHGSNQAYGVVVAVQAIGGIAGGLVAASIGHRVSAVRLFGIGSVVFGCVDLAIFLYPLGYVAVWPSIVGMIVVGVPGALTLAGLMTLFQRNSEDAYRGRVFGALGAVEGVAVLLGTVGAGFLGEAVGIIPVLAFQGAAYVIAGGFMLVLLRGPEAERRPAVAAVELGTPEGAVGSTD